jgi:hypothetical protein
MVATWLREKIAHPNGTSGGSMQRAIFVALGTGAVISSAAALGIGAATFEPQALSRQDYLAAMRTIETTREAILARCDALEGHPRELCRIEAAAAEMVRVAELDARLRRNEQAERALQRARIDARYQVDRARCGAFGGFKRDRCLIQAHAVKGRALLDAAHPYEVRF